MLGQDPNSASPWADLGKVLGEIGDFAEGSKAFDEAVKLEPENPSNYKSLAVTLELQDRYDEANSGIEQGLSVYAGT